MEIKIQINKCSDCKHGSHTGGLTKGGAKPCCDHTITVKESGCNPFNRIIPYRNEPNDYSVNDSHVPKGIPIWCPLKRGYKY